MKQQKSPDSIEMVHHRNTDQTIVYDRGLKPMPTRIILIEIFLKKLNYFSFQNGSYFDFVSWLQKLASSIHLVFRSNDVRIGHRIK